MVENEKFASTEKHFFYSTIICMLSQDFLVSLKVSIQLSIKSSIKFYRRLTIVVFLLYTEVVIFTKDKGPIICMFFIIEVQIVKGKGH